MRHRIPLPQTKFTAITSFAERLVFHSRFSIFLPICLAITVLINGIWVGPAAERLWRMARNPYSNPFAANHGNEWLLDNYLLPWLAHTVGAATSLQVYILFCLALFLIGLTIIVLFVRRHKGEYIARSTLVVFALSPVSLVSLGWLGYVDFLTVFFGFVVALYWGNLWALLLSAFLMGFSHAPQGIVILVIAFLAHLGYTPRCTVRQHIVKLLIAATALVGAFVLLHMHFMHCGVHQTFTRLTYLSNRGVEFYALSVLNSWHLLWYSFFGVVWIFVLMWVRQASFRSLVFVGSAFAVSLAATLLNIDQTRVFSLLSFPVLLIIIKNWPSANGNGKYISPSSVFVWMIIGSIFLPKVIVWDGKPYGSLVFHDIAITARYFSGKETLNFHNQRWLNEPFGR